MGSLQQLLEMMLLKLPSLFCLLLIVGRSSANKRCKEMPGDPGQMVAHGIHSLSLNMLRHYFEPLAGVDNGIPTVNLNRSEENNLNENAVFVNLTNSHPYPPFFALDHILSHMDDEHYGIKNANPLDEIGHAMHMHSIWERASELYKKIAAKKVPKETLLQMPPGNLQRQHHGQSQAAG